MKAGGGAPAAPARRLADLPPLPFPRFLVALPPPELPEDPISLHQAFEGAECRFDPSFVTGDLEGTTGRGGRQGLPPRITGPPIF